MVAADSSMPDNPLYSVKLTTEQVRLTLTTSQMGKVRLCTELADRRVAEIAYMADKGDAEQVELITQRLGDKLDLLVVLIGGEEVVAAPGVLMAPPPEATPPPTEEAPPPAEETMPPVVVPQPQKGWGGQNGGDRNGNRAQLRDTVASHAAQNQAVLSAALDKAPGRARLALRQAIAVSEDGYNKVLEALGQP